MLFRSARARLTAELAGLEEAVVELKQRVNYYERRLKARPFWERRRKIDELLRELPVVDQFPEGGVEQMELLRKQRQSLQFQIESIQRENEQRRMRRMEQQSLNDPAERARRPTNHSNLAMTSASSPLCSRHWECKKPQIQHC